MTVVVLGVSADVVSVAGVVVVVVVEVVSLVAGVAAVVALASVDAEAGAVAIIVRRRNSGCVRSHASNSTKYHGLSVSV